MVTDSESRLKSFKVVGDNFWVLSKCVHNNITLITRYFDENTIVCEDYQDVKGQWFVTNNDFF